VFVELMPLLKERTLLITVARVDERVKVNVIPAKAKEGEDHSLQTDETSSDRLPRIPPGPSVTLAAQMVSPVRWILPSLRILQ